MDVDKVDEVEWQEMKEELREEKMPFLIIQGRSHNRAMQASKIQDFMGEYYIWETPKKGQTFDLIKKMNYIGGEGVVVGDTKVWTNSEEVKKAMHGQLAREDITEKLGTKNGQTIWGKVIGDAIRRQMDVRENQENNHEQSEKYQPGMLIISEKEKDEQAGHVQEICYVDSFGEYWDEITQETGKEGSARGKVGRITTCAPTQSVLEGTNTTVLGRSRKESNQCQVARYQQG